jgi:hypothetical protein
LLISASVMLQPRQNSSWYYAFLTDSLIEVEEVHASIADIEYWNDVAFAKEGGIERMED